MILDHDAEVKSLTHRVAENLEQATKGNAEIWTATCSRHDADRLVADLRRALEHATEIQNLIHNMKRRD